MHKLLLILTILFTSTILANETSQRFTKGYGEIPWGSNTDFVLKHLKAKNIKASVDKLKRIQFEKGETEITLSFFENKFYELVHEVSFKDPQNRDSKTWSTKAKEDYKDLIFENDTIISTAWAWTMRSTSSFSGTSTSVYLSFRVTNKQISQQKEVAENKAIELKKLEQAKKDKELRNKNLKALLNP